MGKPEVKRLIGAELKIVNIGLDGFARDLERQGISVTQVDWKPPAGGNPHLAKLLAKLGA